MSEYMEKHTASKLIGAPPGYVGYDEGGQLSEKVRRKPYSVVLLDEIEKAHPDIFNMLLQILDDGRLTDNQGRLINFENTVVIMTTNAGSHIAGRSLGFVSGQPAVLSQQIHSALKETFRPEFLNRVDDVITFEPLTKEQLRQIVGLMLKDVYKAAAEHGMKVQVSEDVISRLAEEGYDPAYGARPLRRLIQREIEDEIAEAYLKGEIQDHDSLRISLGQNHKITIEKNREIV
jgi:ATP-dependent Clp protease ATP-binding subunit ClpC